MQLVLTDLTEKKRDWRWTFLKVLAETCSVTEACLASHVSRPTAYDHRRKFPKFRKKWDEALGIGVEILEVESRRRALDRKDPASHILLMFLLKAHLPHKYRENGHLIPVRDDDDDEGQAVLSDAALANLTSDELDALESISAKLSEGPGEVPSENPGGAGAA